MKIVLNFSKIEKKFLSYYKRNYNDLRSALLSEIISGDTSYGYFDRENVWDYMVDKFCDQLDIPDTVKTKYMPIDRETFMSIICTKLKNYGTWYSTSKYSRFEKVAHNLYCAYDSVKTGSMILGLMEEALDLKPAIVKRMRHQVDKSKVKLKELENLAA